MDKKFTISIYLELFMLTACLLAGSSSCQPGPSEDSVQEKVIDIDRQLHEVKATLVDMWDAIEKGDMKRYASHIHPDFTQFGENDSLLRVGKESELQAIKEWIDQSDAIHTEMEKPRINIYGDVAWIVYYWKDKGITNGEAFATRGKSTRIFVWEEGSWLCIHGHYTLLP